MKPYLHTALLASLFLPFSIQAQAPLIGGTSLRMDYRATGLQVSPHDPKILVNEADQAFLMVERRQVDPATYRKEAPLMLQLKEVLLEEHLGEGLIPGALTKGIFQDERGRKVVWFAWLPGTDHVVDIRGGYPEEMDARLHQPFLDALRGARLDPNATPQPFAGLPFIAEVPGYERKPFMQARSAMFVRKMPQGSRLLLFRAPAVEERTESEGLELQEVLREGDRSLAWTWKETPVQEGRGTEITFHALARFGERRVELIAYGPFGSEYLTELQGIARSMRPQELR